jgi:hypothetical protein
MSAQSVLSFTVSSVPADVPEICAGPGRCRAARSPCVRVPEAASADTGAGDEPGGGVQHMHGGVFFNVICTFSC